MFCGNTPCMCPNVCNSLIKGLKKNVAWAVLTKADATHILQQLKSRFLWKHLRITNNTIITLVIYNVISSNKRQLLQIALLIFEKRRSPVTKSNSSEFHRALSTL